MAEEFHLAGLTISLRPELKEVGDDRDAALPASAALASGSQDAIVRRLDELKRLYGEVHPRLSKVLQPPNYLWEAPKMLWFVRERPLVVPVPLDLGIEEFRKGFAGQFTPEEMR